MSDKNLATKLLTVAHEDVDSLVEAQKSYGDSWKKRGGVGAFMMLARKWDRIEKQVSEQGYDIFHAHTVDEREEGIIDDIRDLRRYLLLVEEHVLHGRNTTYTDVTDLAKGIDDTPPASVLHDG